MLNIAFKVADEHGLLLLALKDLRAMIAEVWEMPASVKAAVGIRHEWRGEDE